MKANGMTPEHIVKYTGLCMEEIINL